MATKTAKYVMNTAASFLAKNPILPASVQGVESDTSMFKIGDGETAWVNLEYANGLFDHSVITEISSALIEIHKEEAEAHAPEDVGADPSGAAQAGISPVELAPTIDWEAATPTLAINYATAKQVQKLGTVAENLVLTKGTGWTTSGTMSYVLLLLTLSGTPTVTYTIVDKWTTDVPTDDGEYLIHLRCIGGTIYAAAEAVAAE